jgi:hypothetical protein
MNSLESAIFAYKATSSLFKDYPHYSSIKRRPLLNKLVQTPPTKPTELSNREEELLNKFQLIIKERGIEGIPRIKRPYWIKNGLYDLFEVYGTAIQFIDQHNGQLPKTTLPPSNDIEAYINRVLKEPSKKVTIDRQFEILLDISRNDIIGAANIGMLGSRLMARFSDQRAYPKLHIDGKVIIYKATPDEEIELLMRNWFNKVARFETFNDVNGRNDVSGDQFYFWTHFFAACIYCQDTIDGKIFQKIFENGNKAMIYVKDKFAKSGTVSDHYEASLLGRNIGLAISSD